MRKQFMEKHFTCKTFVEKHFICKIFCIKQTYSKYKIIHS